MKNALPTILLLLSFSASLNAAPTGASFLSLDQSPQSAALGKAGSATISGTASLYMNPAGIAGVGSSQLSAAHTQLFGDSALSSFALSRPFGVSASAQAFGMSVTYLSYPEISVRHEDGSEGGSIRPSDMALGLSYARIIGGIRMGMTVKALRQRIGDEEASGGAADIGVQMELPAHGMNLGLSVVNLGPSMKFISETYYLPTTARLGLGYSIKNFNVLADVGTPTNGGKAWFSLGTEFTPVSILSLRAGYLVSSESKVKSSNSSSDSLTRFAGLSGGLGLRVGRFTFDYAMIPHELLGNTQRIGLSMNFR